MNTKPGLIGKKLGNTQFFNENGEILRATAIEAGPCVVIRKRSVETDGYAALQLGFGTKREKVGTKAERGALAGLEEQYPEGTLPRYVKEIRVSEEELGNYEVGQALKPSEVFQEGQFVDVSGTSKGRGFTGVMKRHGFSGAATDTHGTHEYRRHGGSIGMNMTPGRTLKNQKMPGQHGNRKVTTLNLRVAKVLDEQNIVLVEGAVPGPRNGFVTVRRAVKKAN